MTETETQWVTIFSSINMVHAGMVRGYLESHDIPVRLLDEHVSSLQISMSVVIGGIKVQVPKEREADAAQLLQELEMHAISGAGERKWAWFAVVIGALSVGVLIGTMLLSKC